MGTLKALGKEEDEGDGMSGTISYANAHKQSHWFLKKTGLCSLPPCLLRLSPSRDDLQSKEQFHTTYKAANPMTDSYIFTALVRNLFYGLKNKKGCMILVSVAL